MDAGPVFRVRERRDDEMLKSAAIRLFRAVMSLIYAVMKLLIRQRPQVVFLSRQSDAPSEDFRLIEEQIRRLEPDTEVCFSCRLGLKSDLGAGYILLMLRQMAMLAGATVCVTESYCPPISILRHRKDLRIVQVWHSMVAIKKFGWQTVDKPEGTSSVTARLMRMHAGYDYIVTGSEYQRRFMAEAMNTPLEKVLPLGQARADRILASDRAAAREALEQAYPQTVGKRVIAYLPTMRRGRAVPCEAVADCADAGCIVLTKLHPLDRFTDAAGLTTAERLTTEQLLCACDGVISDYSGAAAEASLLGIPVWFYVPDAAQYDAECGINIDARETFPAVTAENGEELRALLSEPYPTTEGERVRELLAGGCSGHSSEDIARLALYGTVSEKDA